MRSSDAGYRATPWTVKDCHSREENHLGIDGRCNWPSPKKVKHNDISAMLQGKSGKCVINMFHKVFNSY